MRKVHAEAAKKYFRLASMSYSTVSVSIVEVPLCLGKSLYTVTLEPPSPIMGAIGGQYWACFNHTGNGSKHDS